MRMEQICQCRVGAHEQNILKHAEQVEIQHRCDSEETLPTLLLCALLPPFLGIIVSRSHVRQTVV